MTRAVALSDPAVIEELNEHFVSLEINLSTQDFPPELGGLSLWQKGFVRDSRYSLGFATSVVLGPEGKVAFGTSGCGHLGEVKTAINYNPAPFLEYLQAARARWVRSARAAEENDGAALAEVQAEVRSQLREANRCKCPVKKEILPEGF